MGGYLFTYSSANMKIEALEGLHSTVNILSFDRFIIPVYQPLTVTLHKKTRFFYGE
jgi:hypothetical protein